MISLYNSYKRYIKCHDHIQLMFSSQNTNCLLVWLCLKVFIISLKARIWSELWLEIFSPFYLSLIYHNTGLQLWEELGSSSFSSFCIPPQIVRKKPLNDFQFCELYQEETMFIEICFFRFNLLKLKPLFNWCQGIICNFRY